MCSVQDRHFRKTYGSACREAGFESGSFWWSRKPGAATKAPRSIVKVIELWTFATSRRPSFKASRNHETPIPLSFMISPCLPRSVQLRLACLLVHASAVGGSRVAVLSTALNVLISVTPTISPFYQLTKNYP